MVFIGHSFIKRFEDYFRRFQSCLDFNGQSVEVTFHGFGGAHVNDSRIHQAANSISSTDLVFLDIGSNDLSDVNSNPRNIAKNIFDLACTMVDSSRAVVILEIIWRMSADPNYNCRVQTCNATLRQYTLNAPHIYFWKHRVGLNSPTTRTPSDGVHLSNHTGYPKYARSIRDCIQFFRLRLQLKGTGLSVNLSFDVLYIGHFSAVGRGFSWQKFFPLLLSST